MDMNDVRLDRPPPNGAYYTLGDRYFIPRGCVFVFGSNLAGRHGAGAAKTAKERFGAKYGIGEGYFTDPMPDGSFWTKSYALPTKDKNIRRLSLDEIAENIHRFISRTDMATLDFPDQQLYYYLTPVATGLAGYKHKDIAPLFKDACNCWFPDVWRPYLGDKPTFRELKVKSWNP